MSRLCCFIAWKWCSVWF